jgi:uncharacterized membrane protein YhaH (DUF805 family)
VDSSLKFIFRHIWSNVQCTVGPTVLGFFFFFFEQSGVHFKRFRDASNAWSRVKYLFFTLGHLVG